MSQKLTMFRRDSKIITLTASIDNIPVDLTDGTVWMSAARHYGDKVNVFDKSSPDGGIEITDPSGGIAVITLSPEDTEGLPNETVTLVYDIQIETSDGIITTIQTGTIVVSPDVA